MSPYIQHSLEPVLEKAVKQFPTVVLTGLRQAGKTTLLKHLFSKTHKYLSLEPPDVRLAAASDPRGFIELYQPPVIFDEIQYAPDLLFYIKEKIDEQRSKYGQYILTSSQNILLLQQVTETLAGRVAILRLLPLSYLEIIHQPFDLFAWEKKDSRQRNLPIEDFWKLMLHGSYPELRDIGISMNTAKAWLGVLEATYQVILLRPYFVNINKRLVKIPKFYFTDVGTLCYLTGLRDLNHLISGPMAGAVAETFIITEIFKRISNRGLEPQVYFWRTSSGVEVDLLIEDQGKLIPIEIKSTSTPKPQMADSMISFRKDMQKAAEHIIALPFARL